MRIIVIVLKLFLINVVLLHSKEINNCKFNYIPLNGEVKIVEWGEDFKVRIVDFNADLDIMISDSPRKCGEWMFVDWAEDFKIKFVESGEDFTVHFVDDNPGIPTSRVVYYYSSGSSMKSDLDNCKCKTTQLSGEVKVVESGEDFEVRVVESNADLDVMISDSPRKCGEWEFVDWSEDFKIEFVESGEDFTIRFVDDNPGMQKVY